jgi:hypothetical protein
VAIRTFGWYKFETLRASDSEGFAIELYRLRWLRKPQHVATVWRAETDEPGFEVHMGPGYAPEEFLEPFIAAAKVELQESWAGWAENNPHLR